MDPRNPYDEQGRALPSEARWLREHPGEWAIICRDDGYSRGRDIQRGRYALFPKGEFEIRVKTGEDYVIDVIGRYIGETEEW